jgi:uncharacterized phage-associated protein
MRFREDKATQAAARILVRAGGRMRHLKLIKLLYLVERESLTRFGVPVTWDAYVSMPYGPVMSATLDRINEREEYAGGYWDRHIAPKVNYEVRLREGVDVPRDQLSEAEEAIIDEVVERFGRMDRWTLVELTHRLPEWTDPQGSSIPIDPADILRSEGFSAEEIAELQAQWAEMAYVDSLLG